MATNGEVIQRVQSLYSKGVQSDDSRMSNRHIYSKLLSARSRVITLQIRKKQKVSDWNYLILPCVELIEVPSHECPCLPEFGCPVYRTKYPLPKPLTDLSSNLIEWVMTIDSGKRISIIPREAYVYNSGNKYTKDNLKGVLENRHIYFYGKAIPEVVRMKLLPEDPEEVYSYPSKCPCQDCDECESLLDKQFPIDADMLDTVIELAVKELVGIFGAVEDQTNNSADNPREQTK